MYKLFHGSFSAAAERDLGLLATELPREEQ